MAEQNYRRLQCAHEKPLFSNGKPRLSCFECSPKPIAKERKKYEVKSKTDCQCAVCGSLFAKTLPHNKYCSYDCKVKGNNLSSQFSRLDRTARVCRCCGVVFTPEYGNKNKLQCSTECLLEMKRQRKQKSIEKNMRDDPVIALARKTRTFICKAIAKGGFKKGSKTNDILGCDWNTFKNHIEKQFKRGMSWGARSAWHIDHIVPMASASNEIEAIALNHFTNLRPMWAKDNLSKGAQLTHLI